MLVECEVAAGGQVVVFDLNDPYQRCTTGSNALRLIWHSCFERS